jgi:hypothetical protein
VNGKNLPWSEDKIKQEKYRIKKINWAKGREQGGSSEEKGVLNV